MHPSQRLRRPVLERSQPHRTWKNLYIPTHGAVGEREPAPQGNAEALPSEAHAVASAPTSLSATDAREAPPRAAEPAQVEQPAHEESTLQQGVRAGYRVIDEYLSSAQAFASRLAPATEAAPRALSERVVQHATDLAGAWLELLRVGMQSPTQAHAASAQTDIPPFGIPYRAPEAPAQPPAAQSIERLPIAIDVQSARRVVTRVELLEQAVPLRCRAHALRHIEERRARIEPLCVDIERGSGRPLLRVQLSVGTETRPGEYRALLLDADTNRPFGSLHVEVHP